jgi:hypothetical protein
MDINEDIFEYLDDLASKLIDYQGETELGQEMQTGIRLSKTDRGARTNARIEASQKKESFNEAETTIEELEDVEDDITNELLSRAIKDIFGE